MNILVTNDDGIESESLHLLQERLEIFGNVIAVVPDRERSGASHSITISKPLKLKSAGKNLYTLDGTPADCVSVVLLGGLSKKKIDLVVSGINKGPNLSEDVFYSGTVAAAREGSLFGVPSLAVSLDSFVQKPDFKFSVDLVEQFIAKHTFMKKALININIPDLPADKIKGVKVTKLGWRKYKDVLVKRKGSDGHSVFMIQGKGIKYDKTAGRDCAEVKKGFVSVTPLNLDLTDHTALALLKRNIRGFFHG